MLAGRPICPAEHCPAVLLSPRLQLCESGGLPVLTQFSSCQAEQCGDNTPITPSTDPLWHQQDFGLEPSACTGSVPPGFGAGGDVDNPRDDMDNPE